MACVITLTSLPVSGRVVRAYSDIVKFGKSPTLNGLSLPPVSLGIIGCHPAPRNGMEEVIGSIPIRSTKFISLTIRKLRG